MRQNDRIGFDDLPVRAASGRRVILRFGFRAYLAYEAATGEPAMAAILRYERGEMVRATDLAELLRAGAVQHQPAFTREDAADVLDAQPDAIAKALRISLPEPEGGMDGAPKKAVPLRRALSLRPLWRRFWRHG